MTEQGDGLAGWRSKPNPPPQGMWWEDPNAREAHARVVMRQQGLPLGDLDEETEQEGA